MKKIRSEYKVLLNELPKLLAPETAYDIDESFLAQFIVASARIKHRGFREEGEVRLIVVPRSPEGQQIEQSSDLPRIQTLWRATAGGEAQYVELFGRDLPIVRVMVEPSRHQQVNERRVKACLPDLPANMIQLSDTPFIG